MASYHGIQKRKIYSAFYMKIIFNSPKLYKYVGILLKYIKINCEKNACYIKLYCAGNISLKVIFKSWNNCSIVSFNSSIYVDIAYT